MDQGARTTWAAYARPDPKPSSSTGLPDGISPCSTMRESASGMDAADVLPDVTMSRAMTASRQAEPAHERVDDAQVRLVRDEGCDVGEVDAGAAARLERDRRHLRRWPSGRPPGPPGGRTASSRRWRPSRAARRRNPTRSGPIAGSSDRADHGGARAVAEDDAGRAVVHVQPAGEPLGRDDEDVARLAGADRGRRGAERVDEAGAAGTDVVRAGRVDAEPVGKLRRGGGHRFGHRAGRDEDEVDVGRRDAAVGQRLAAGGLGHVDDRLVRVGPAPLGDADARLDPLVVGVDAARDQVVVGDDVGRPVVAEPQHAGAGRTGLGGDHPSVPFEMRTSGQPGGDDVAVVRSHSVSTPACGDDDLVLLAVGADRAEPGAASDLAALVHAVGAGEHALGRRDHDAELGRVLALAVLRAALDERPRLVQVVRGLDREQFDAGQLALGDAGERARPARVRGRR